MSSTLHGQKTQQEQPPPPSPLPTPVAQGQPLRTALAVDAADHPTLQAAIDVLPAAGGRDLPPGTLALDLEKVIDSVTEPNLIGPQTPEPAQ